MSSFVLQFQEIDQTTRSVVGGKGANLGELANIAGIHVPDGFCVTVDAFQRMLDDTPLIDEYLGHLSLLKIEDRDKIAELSGEMRRVIEGIAIPQDISEAISRHLAKLGENDAYAVRSSATVEDLPTASFAGQQDTYLNIVGKEAILTHVSKCWASLYRAGSNLPPAKRFRSS
ncbi:MAG: PEP/pyruvate-binding domain-containing protein [Caldilineaceae bacterium]